MNDNVNSRAIAYFIIALGCFLSIVAAVVPNYNIGYKLLFNVLIFGLVPYVMYGMMSELLRGWLLIVPGILILVIDLFAILPERFPNFSGYSNIVVYWAPLFCAFIIVPISYLAAKKLQSLEPVETTVTEKEEKDSELMHH
jgi:hypothetical protein